MGQCGFTIKKMTTQKIYSFHDFSNEFTIEIRRLLFQIVNEQYTNKNEIVQWRIKINREINELLAGLKQFHSQLLMTNKSNNRMIIVMNKRFTTEGEFIVNIKINDNGIVYCPTLSSYYETATLCTKLGLNIGISNIDIPSNKIRETLFSVHELDEIGAVNDGTTLYISAQIREPNENY